MNTRDEPAPVRYWRPASSPDVYMLRVENQRHTATTFSERYAIVIVREGAFEGWYRGAMHVHAAGQLKLYDESQLHRHVRRIVGTTLGRFARSLAIPVCRSGQHRPGHDGASALSSHA